ncbi:hypothetical protein [Aeromonas veronii]|uniref:hypothetical protein n=1 Tax=Aeromonas veronii TaxID=654 RepID=UPI000E1F0BD5|nr:hypothetical protein [Aeromonas veronii]RDU80948.1 hypothetical protein CHF44_12975 [Aeromonas veronii]RDU88349.1 hypothetical protein CHH34_20540 [Aeromonas veronii]
MATLLNSIAYKPSLKIAPDHVLIKNSVHQAIAKVSYSKNNPMFSVSQRTVLIEGMDNHNPLDVDHTGIAPSFYSTAKQFDKTTQYEVDDIFKLNGRLFKVEKKTIFATAVELKTAIISGELTPIVSGIREGETLPPQTMTFNDVSVRGQAVLRQSAISASSELVEDLAAYGGSWDKVLEDTVIRPTINDLDREIVFTALQIANKREAVDILPKQYISARNLYNMVELERQRIFTETGRPADTFICSGKVLALLLAGGQVEPVREVEVIETIIDSEDETETLTEENVIALPNRFISNSGVLFMACDLFKPDDEINLELDYFMAVAKVEDDEVGVAPLYLHHYIPDGDVVSLYEFTDSNNFHPQVRASLRYGLITAPFYSDDKNQKVIWGDSPEFVKSMNGKSPLLSFTPINFDYGINHELH